MNISENLNYKIVAFAIALILWGTVLARREVIYLKNVDIRFITGEQMIVKNDLISQVEFRLSGSRVALRRFIQRQVEPIQVDLSGVAPGRRQIQIPEESLRLPIGIRVVSINPVSLTVDLAEAAVRDLPVDAKWVEEDLSEFKVQLAAVEPPVIRVRGTKDELALLKGLTVEDFAMDRELEERLRGLRVGETLEISVGLPKMKSIQFLNAPKDSRVTLRMVRRS
jgi:YbbR domain-containing protein